MREKMTRIEYFVDSRVKDTHAFTLLYFAATLAFKSSHPLALSIVKEAEANPKVKIKDIAKDFCEVPGIGMTGLIIKNSKQDTRFYFGNKNYVTKTLKISDKIIDPRALECEKDGKIVLFFTNQYRILGYIVAGT